MAARAAGRPGLVVGCLVANGDYLDARREGSGKIAE
jgi:hypothetical protein